MTVVRWLFALLAVVAVGCEVESSGQESNSAPGEELDQDTDTETDISADSEPGPEPEADANIDIGPVALLDPYALVPVAPDSDPLLEHRPDDVACPAGAWGPEGGGFEIQTGVCAYAAFDQPLPVSLQAGDALEIVIWHDFLDAPEPAESHLALWVGTTVLWETEIAIPAASNSFELTVELTETPPPTARLGFHLHNHGYNSWRLMAVDLVPN